MRAGLVVREVDRGWNDLKKTVNALKDKRAFVKVGFIEEGQGSEDHGNGLTNAQVGLFNEFGTATIPERSFIRATFETKKDEYLSLLAKLVKGVYSRKVTVEKALQVVGLKVSTDIKKTVTAGDQVPPPNAPSTAARKQALGRGLIRTLVDTGRMIAALSYAVMIGPRVAAKGAP